MRPTPITVLRQFQEHKQGKIVAIGVGSSTRQGGHYKRLSGAEYLDKMKKTVENEEEDNIDEYPRDVPRNGTYHLNSQGKLEIFPPTSKC
ncbi:hypothetical protein V6N11_064900 [Hibiscus sabdariffa]|uniref:Uncharacterized protein n=1 Tax=Hibiscus sabdariffa TaxID=183260 RepID=A0ABR2SJ06_9ROSI